MSSPTPYLAAACQTDLPAPKDHAGIAATVDHQLIMIERAVVGYQPFGDVRLVVFPEFSHAAPIYETAAELHDKLAVTIPNEHTDRYVAVARERNIFIQTGSFLECDAAYPGHVFNTTCLIGPDGILSTYRKVNPWLPWEVHTSPHDLPGYDRPLFPVVETEIGCLGAAICYDWLFPEAIRQLAMAGGEVLIRVSAYMDPWGATPPLDWWTVVNRCRAIENLAYVVAANQAASAANFPPFSWPGGSMVVDFDGRLLAQADPGPHEKIVIAPIDIAALRVARQRRTGHQMLAQLRSETAVLPPIFPQQAGPQRQPPRYESNEAATAAGRAALDAERARRQQFLTTSTGVRSGEAMR